MLIALHPRVSRPRPTERVYSTLSTPASANGNVTKALADRHSGLAAMAGPRKSTDCVRYGPFQVPSATHGKAQNRNFVVIPQAPSNQPQGETERPQVDSPTTAYLSVSIHRAAAAEIGATKWRQPEAGTGSILSGRRRAERKPVMKRRVQGYSMLSNVDTLDSGIAGGSRTVHHVHRYMLCCMTQMGRASLHIVAS